MGGIKTVLNNGCKLQECLLLRQCRIWPSAIHTGAIAKFSEDRVDSMADGMTDRTLPNLPEIRNLRPDWDRITGAAFSERKYDARD